MSTGRAILVALATMVIFATGVITGGLLVRKTTVAAPPVPPAMTMFPGRFDAVRRATEQLADLTPAQRQRINAVIRDSQEHLADFFLLFEPDIQGVFRKMREDIRAELTPDQRRRMEEFLRQRLRRPNAGSGLRPGDGVPPGPLRRPGPMRDREPAQPATAPPSSTSGAAPTSAPPAAQK